MINTQRLIALVTALCCVFILSTSVVGSALLQHAPSSAKQTALAEPKSASDGLQPVQPAVAGDEKWDNRFGLPGLDNRTYAVATSGSNVYVGGTFLTAGGNAATRVARWDGSRWYALGSGVNGTVRAITASGANVYVGGNFTSAGGVPVNNIARWDGSQWHALGSGVVGGDTSNPPVRAIAISGADVYVGGSFTTAGGAVAQHIARWNGSQWSQVGSGLGGTVDEYVAALTIDGTSIYAGGFFRVGNSFDIARWDGAAWQGMGSGVSGSFPTYVDAIAVSGSDVYVGGSFDRSGQYYGLFSVARWDGAQWRYLGDGFYPFGQIVYSLAVVGSDVYAGGYLRTTGNVSVLSVARWDGAEWHSVGAGLGSPIAGGPVYGLAVLNGGVYAVGAFSRTGDDLPAGNIARWDGAQWRYLDRTDKSYFGVDRPVYTLAISGTNVYAGGDFFTAGGVDATHIARWDGSQWNAMGSGIEINSYVLAIAVIGTDVYVGGQFGTAGGVSVSNIARWDGSQWSALGSGTDAPVNSMLAVGNDLYVGGQFGSAGGVTAHYIARWDGSQWHSVGTGSENGVGNAVSSLAWDGSNLYVGGYFSMAGSVPANSIAKWNGSQWSALGSGTDGVVQSIVATGSNLYVGGRFTSAGGIPANNVAMWNGSQWSALGSGTSGGYNSVSAVTVPGTDVYIGGYFTTAGGVAANNIAKWNGSQWLALGSGTNNGVLALAVQGTNLFVGGDFRLAGNKYAGYLSVWHTGCWIPFTDVPDLSTFYPYVRCMVCGGIVSGYACGGPGEPCDSDNNPYFRPASNITRGQLSKIVSNSAAFNDPPGAQRFADVPPGSTFYDFVQRLASRSIIGGYACGGPGEPCGVGNLPYFRTNNNATRGQISKIVSQAAGFNDPAGSRIFEDVAPGSTYYDYVQRLASRSIIGGYACGGVGEPCGVGNRPYFRPNNNATRGQTSKIVSNAFFPSCNIADDKETR